MSVQQSPLEDGLPLARRRRAIVALALAVTMAVLDGSISNVALPSIAADLQVSPASSIAVVNAYQLAITVSLLPLASLGEIVGYQRIYRAGLALFVVASLICALSGSLAALTLARIVQGFGAAGIMSVNTALIRFIYPQRLLGRGIGINAMVIAIASAIGPTVAAGILSVGPWPLLFAVNIPVGSLALVLALKTLPRTPRAARRFDAGSALLSAATFGLPIAAINGAGRALPPAAAAAMVALAAICGMALVRRQVARPAPLLPVDLLRIPVFALSVCTSIAAFTAQMLAFVALPFYIQTTLGRSEVQTGLLMTPWPLGLALMSVFAGRLSDRFSAGLLGAAGLLGQAAGLLLIVLLPPHPTDAALIWRLALAGAGFGLFQTPNNRAMLSAAPRHRTGGASGMLSTARLLGQTAGAALAAMIFTLAASGGPIAALTMAAVCSLAASVVSATRLKLRPA